MAGVSIEGLKIVTAREMARIEGMACDDGASEQGFMEKAGEVIAGAVENYLALNDLPKTATLLVGKGNNGGDAFAAGARLSKKGYKVTAFHIYSMDSCSPLCRKMYEKFRVAGGIVRHVKESSFAFEPEGVILDGLVGTGFKGKAEGILKLAIEKANGSGTPIIAIDIPSGVNGNTGEVGTVAIKAMHTIYLGLPKIGFFLNQGWDHVGRLHYASFGLEEKYIAAAKPAACLFNDEDLPDLLPPMVRTRHKYQAGYVLAVAGSPGMPGAALLSSFGALKAGAGIVRLFHPVGMEAELSAAPPELIRQGWNGKDLSVIKTEAKRAKAMLIGPGIGRTPQAKKMVHQLLEKIQLPMVIDADALFFLAQNSSWKLPKGSVITPHRGEMDLLLGKALHSKKEKMDYHKLCQEYVDKKGVTLVLKGAPTFIFHPKTVPIVITRGDPGMATAGSGDVLTGIIASMIAQGLSPRLAAALSAYLHGASGEAAARSLTSYCVTAGDLIEFLPDAFLEAQD